MPILAFIKDLIIATFSQMASLFTGIFIFGLLIHFTSQLTFKSLGKSFGRNSTYFIAWLGTPIHELGHALFCLIFMHKIVDIKFFKPDPLTGTLGYVHHTWNRSNPWQMLGNLFIGIGPVILGCVVLFALFNLLIPNSSQVWDSILLRVNEVDKNRLIGSYLEIFGDSAFEMTRLTFTLSNLTSLRFWVFCYLSICVASNIRLSLSDIKGALSGLGCLILLFFLINLLGLVTSLGGARFFPFTISSLSIVYGILIFALIMVLIGFVLIYSISVIYFKIRYKRMLHPF
ncbi:MAG: hypothetical protein JSV32_02680 [Dehalococcoidia bacterium]|nr:MAG: hypothetical protein JSV32_02680 [Dehalococcoidia bacterium]